ncbi:MAG: hypothetical protein WBO30_00790, partial [Ferruginibacter sp.]
ELSGKESKQHLSIFGFINFRTATVLLTIYTGSAGKICGLPILIRSYAIKGRGFIYCRKITMVKILY